MTRTEVVTIMTAIKTAYPNYYKSQVEIEDAINIWAEMLVDDEPAFIAKAVKGFIKNDTSGFPPSIGQIRGLAKDIRKSEWEAKQRQIDQLPEPPVNATPMPDDLRHKLQAWLKGTEV